MVQAAVAHRQVSSQAATGAGAHGLCCAIVSLAGSHHVPEVIVPVLGFNLLCKAQSSAMIILVLYILATSVLAQEIFLGDDPVRLCLAAFLSGHTLRAELQAVHPQAVGLVVTWTGHHSRAPPCRLCLAAFLSGHTLRAELQAVHPQAVGLVVTWTGHHSRAPPCRNPVLASTKTFPGQSPWQRFPALPRAFGCWEPQGERTKSCPQGYPRVQERREKPHLEKACSLGSSLILLIRAGCLWVWQTAMHKPQGHPSQPPARRPRSDHKCSESEAGQGQAVRCWDSFVEEGRSGEDWETAAGLHVTWGLKEETWSGVQETDREASGWSGPQKGVLAFLSAAECASQGVSSSTANAAAQCIQQNRRLAETRRVLIRLTHQTWHGDFCVFKKTTEGRGSVSPAVIIFKDSNISWIFRSQFVNGRCLELRPARNFIPGFTAVIPGRLGDRVAALPVGHSLASDDALAIEEQTQRIVAAG
ncbi:hypothetical protein H920_00094 [Fukomys damarensis]|uniref:Uncharacterized protein n=1 Tax=Fukomys damarensis TaxID=885580 RepID=A0A091E757_FUKDA|nr:hypothetical protein H920_00094 [Fukomys damarensis]